jgi:hypothetical protein
MQGISKAENLSFLDCSLYLLIQLAPQLSSWGWVGPAAGPLLKNLVAPGIEPGTSESVARIKKRKR